MNKNRTTQPKKKSRMMDGTEENVSKKHRTHLNKRHMYFYIWLLRCCFWCVFVVISMVEVPFFLYAMCFEFCFALLPAQCQ